MLLARLQFDAHGVEAGRQPACDTPEPVANDQLHTSLRIAAMLVWEGGPGDARLIYLRAGRSPTAGSLTDVHQLGIDVDKFDVVGRYFN